MSKCFIAYPFWPKLFEVNSSLFKKICRRRWYRLDFSFKLKIELPTKFLSRNVSILIGQTDSQLNQSGIVNVFCHSQILFMFGLSQVDQFIVVLLNGRKLGILDVRNKNTIAIILYFLVKTEIFYISSWKLSDQTSIMVASSSEFMNITRGFSYEEQSSVSSVGRQ